MKLAVAVWIVAIATSAAALGFFAGRETGAPRTALATAPAQTYDPAEVVSIVQTTIRTRSQRPMFVVCDTADFRPDSRMWVVSCSPTKDGPATLTFTLSDTTGKLIN